MQCVQSFGTFHLAAILRCSEENAAPELFSDVASAYPALRDVTLDFVVKHWATVRSSSAYKKVKERADGGDLPIGAAHLSAKTNAPWLGSKPMALESWSSRSGA